MWSHRSSGARRCVIRCRSEWVARALGADVKDLLSGFVPVLDGSRLDLDISLKLLRERLVGRRQLLADDLIGAVLTRGFDTNRVCTSPDGFSRVVLSVPGQHVLARWARGA